MKKVVRTAGDGIDNSIMKENILPQTKAVHSLNLNEETYTSILKSLKPIELKSTPIQLIPRYIPCDKKVSKYLIKKPKEPKFVPYEPYKAAVKPFMMYNSLNKQECAFKNSKNDAEIQNLVSQVVEIRKSEMEESISNKVELDDTSRLKILWAKEKQSLETDIGNLKETNSHLENQLKFQAQVNLQLKMEKHIIFQIIG